MGTMSVPRKTPSHSRRLQTGIFGFSQKGTGASFCFFLFFFLCTLMYITGAKFEDHCSNISGDIPNSVFYRFSGTIYDVITSLICMIKNLNPLKRKKIFQKGKHHSSLL